MDPSNTIVGRELEDQELEMIGDVIMGTTRSCPVFLNL